MGVNRCSGTSRAGANRRAKGAGRNRNDQGTNCFWASGSHRVAWNSLASPWAPAMDFGGRDGNVVSMSRDTVTGIESSACPDSFCSVSDDPFPDEGGASRESDTQISFQPVKHDSFYRTHAREACLPPPEVASVSPPCQFLAHRLRHYAVVDYSS